MSETTIQSERTPTTEQLLAAQAVLQEPLPDAPVYHPVLQAAHDESMALFHPGGGNIHRLEWEPDPVTKRPRYLGASTLVKKPAQEYALRLMLKQGQEDESNGYWARRGNLFAFDHLKRVTPYRENRVSIPLDNYDPALVGVDLIGHYDGLRLSLEDGTNVSFESVFDLWRRTSMGEGITLYLTPEEFKNYDAATDGKVDLAGRQVILYNAMLRRFIALCRDVHAEKAAWPYTPEPIGLLPLANFHNAAEDPDARALNINDLSLHSKGYPGLTVFGGVVLIDQGREEEGFCQPIDDSDGLSDRVFDWVLQKAKAIMVSVRAFEQMTAPKALTGKDPVALPVAVKEAMLVPGGVEDYQASPLGLQEFRMEMTAIEANVDNDRLLTEALLYEASRLTSKASEVEKDEAGGKALAIIAQAGTDERSITCEADDGTKVKVTMVRHPSGSFYPKVTIRADWGKTAAGIIAHIPKAAPA